LYQTSSAVLLVKPLQVLGATCCVAAVLSPDVDAHVEVSVIVIALTQSSLPGARTVSGVSGVFASPVSNCSFRAFGVPTPMPTLIG